MEVRPPPLQPRATRIPVYSIPLQTLGSRGGSRRSRTRQRRPLGARRLAGPSGTLRTVPTRPRSAALHAIPGWKEGRRASRAGECPLARSDRKVGRGLHTVGQAPLRYPRRPLDPFHRPQARQTMREPAGQRTWPCRTARGAALQRKVPPCRNVRSARRAATTAARACLWAAKAGEATIHRSVESMWT